MEIKVYTTPVCLYCKKVKEFLTKNNLSYKEVNIIDDLEAQQEMVSKSGGLAVPVVDINGTIFVGYNEKGMSKTLGL